MAKIPHHIAVIMDGNGRWAKKRGLPRIFGHRKGAKRVRDAIRLCRVQGVKVLTLFALSVENYLHRPKSEVESLIELLSDSILSNLDELCQNKVRLRFIGDLSVFPKKLLNEIQQAEQLTQFDCDLEVLVAINYSGRWDILQAVDRYAAQCRQQPVFDAQVHGFSSYLATADYSDPDLLIRTGGDKRVSNFMLWQCAYTEICFFDEYWPDFSEELFLRALTMYRHAQRNFGRTQVEGSHD
mgnify:CR=1 FL=1